MGADEHRHLLDALAFVDPSRCTYQEWVDVGMALHESGFSWLDWDDDTGAWIRFNPLDGKGVGNHNVTEFRYALVESDALDVARQRPMIEAMNLPCAAIVSSAGKSVHAIVRIDAGNDYDTYRKRVERLYAYCRQHGFEPDTQNKNPSRLSRMPGATRGGSVQALLATNVGAESWDAWEAWVAESEDDLPDEEVGNWDDPIILKPPLIGQDAETDCILRQGQKMIVVGDSKMGKSYTLIDLAEAICVGGEWLGLRCTKGKVFYVNLEIDPAEFRWRQHRVWDARPERSDDCALADVNANFVHWPMRGHAALMDDIAPKLIRRMLRYGPPGTFEVAIIDPIYKVNGGDDNDAKAVSRFTNELDHIATACGCAVIYAHHHPKGAVGSRKSIDRMSGSGVYGRDADTVLDFSPLYADARAREQFGETPLFRTSVDVRSFGHRKAIDAMFLWPRFLRDPDGSLARLKVVGEDPTAEGADKGKKAREDQAEERRRANIDMVRAAIGKCGDDAVLATRANVYERLRLHDGHMAGDVKEYRVKKVKDEESGKMVDAIGEDGKPVMAPVPYLSTRTLEGWTTKGNDHELGPFSMSQQGKNKVILDDGTYDVPERLASSGTYATP